MRVPNGFVPLQAGLSEDMVNAITSPSGQLSIRQSDDGQVVGMPGFVNPGLSYHRSERQQPRHHRDRRQAIRDELTFTQQETDR